MYHNQSIDVVHEEFRDAPKDHREKLECRVGEVGYHNKLQAFLESIVERLLNVEVAIAQHSLNAINNLGDSQRCQVSMESVYEDRERQRQVVPAVEELTEGLKTAYEWQAGIVQTLGRTREWQVTMNGEFQELCESHEDVACRAYEAYKMTVEVRIVVDQVMNAACQDITASSCCTDNSSERLQSTQKPIAHRQGTLNVRQLN